MRALLPILFLGLLLLAASPAMADDPATWDDSLNGWSHVVYQDGVYGWNNTGYWGPYNAVYMRGNTTVGQVTLYRDAGAQLNTWSTIECQVWNDIWSTENWHETGIMFGCDNTGLGLIARTAGSTYPAGAWQGVSKSNSWTLRENGAATWRQPSNAWYDWKIVCTGAYARVYSKPVGNSTWVLTSTLAMGSLWKGTYVGILGNYHGCAVKNWQIYEPDLTADFFSNTQNVNTGDTISFYDDSLGQHDGWQWSWGDGTANGTTQNPTHSYSASGIYTVTLTVTHGGESSTKTRTSYIAVHIANNPSTWDTTTSGWTVINYTTTGYFTSSGTSLSIRNNGNNGKTIAYRDGGVSSIDSLMCSHYSDLWATDGWWEGYLLMGANSTGSGGFGVHAMGTSYGAGSDGSIILTTNWQTWSGANTTPRWASHQWYDLRVDCDSNNGTAKLYYKLNTSGTWTTVGTRAMGSNWKGAYVAIMGNYHGGAFRDFILTHSDFHATPTSGWTPLSVSFTSDAVQLGGPTLSYFWDFGDGTTSTEQNPTHSYGSAGTYTVKHTAYNSKGTSTCVKADYISTQSGITADFTGFDTLGAAPLQVSFFDASIGNPETWAWDFGDGDTSDVQNPVHIFQNPGYYDVSLTVTNDAGSSTKTRPDFITVGLPPLPVIDYMSATYGEVPLYVHFTGTDLTGSATSYEWSFGDGSKATGTDVNHTYHSPGNYTVTLNATNVFGTASAYATIHTFMGTYPVSLRVNSRGIMYYPNATVYVTRDNVTLWGVTDSSGRVVMPLQWGGRYNITVLGSTVGTSSNVSTSIYTEFGTYSYDIQVPMTSWTWASRWLALIGMGPPGSPDVTASITTKWAAGGPNDTGHGWFATQYNDTTNSTTSIVFNLYRRDSAEYVTVATQTITASNGTANFTVEDCAGKTYKCNVTSTTSIFGTVCRPGGEYRFPWAVTNPLAGWPAVSIAFLGLLFPLVIALASTRRFELGAGIAILVAMWGLILAGLVPWWGAILSAVVTIALLAYAVVRWREEHQ